MVVRVPEATLEAKHDALHVQPYGLNDGTKQNCIRGGGRGHAPRKRRRGGGGSEYGEHHNDTVTA